MDYIERQKKQWITKRLNGTDIPWNKGKKTGSLSEEHRKKISSSLVGIKRGVRPESHRIHLSNSLKGRIPARGMLGEKTSEETKRKLSLALKGKPQPWNTGENSPNWKSDRTQLVRRQKRNTYFYQFWRKQVLLRDKNECRIMNDDCEGEMEVHHILGYEKYPELRYETSNGIALCHAHHPRGRKKEEELIPYFQQLIKETI